MEVALAAWEMAKMAKMVGMWHSQVQAYGWFSYMPYIQLLEKSIRNHFNLENKLLQPQTNATEPKLQSVHELMGHPVVQPILVVTVL